MSDLTRQSPPLTIENRPAKGALAAPLAFPRHQIIRPGPWLQIGSPHHFEWSRLYLPIPGLHPKLVGLRLLHLADLHLRRRWHRAYDDLISLVNDDPPDLILLTGDIVESHYDPTPALITAQRLLSPLKSRLGTFSVLGNHDGDVLAARLPAWLITPIDARCLTLRDNDAAIELVAGPGVNRADIQTSPVTNMPDPAPGTLRICLSHFPDQTPRLAKSMRPHLLLTGHTHGGQVCLPGGFPLMTHDALPKSQAQGLHRIDQTWMLVSRGLGFAQFRIRTFCSAQAVQVILEPA